MPLGLLGFERFKTYCLFTNPEEKPFLWLQVVGEPKVAFLVMSPYVVMPAYQPEIPDEDAEFLGLKSAQDALILNVVTVRGPQRASVNLKGPIVLNRHTLLGKQVIPRNASEYRRGSCAAGPGQLTGRHHHADSFPQTQRKHRDQRTHCRQSHAGQWRCREAGNRRASERARASAGGIRGDPEKQRSGGDPTHGASAQALSPARRGGGFGLRHNLSAKRRHGCPQLKIKTNQQNPVQ